MADEWIWIPHWDGPEGFQHYTDRDPIWIKNYTRLLSHDAYRTLSMSQRGIIHGIWMEYARSTRRLRGDTASLSRQLGQRVLSVQLKSLCDAGFMQIVDSAALEELASTRATRATRSQEAETETEVEELSVGESSSSNRSDETRTPRASPNGRAAVSQLETLKAYVHRVWDDYPDKGVLVDELGDRGATYAEATNIITAEQEAHD